MGGFIFALTPGKNLQDKIAGAMEKEGYYVLKDQIG